VVDGINIKAVTLTALEDRIKQLEEELEDMSDNDDDDEENDADDIDADIVNKGYTEKEIFITGER
jgi:hypothetical protein